MSKKEENELILRLEAANQQLIGAAVHHATIKEAIELIKFADDIVQAYLPVMEASRPLVLNLERLKGYVRKR